MEALGTFSDGFRITLQEGIKAHSGIKTTRQGHSALYGPVSRGEGDGHGPHGDHDGEIERADGCDDAQRLSHIVARNAAADLQDATLREG